MPSNPCRPGSDTTAAPAAVFPSADPNWRRLDYLAQDNGRQRSAHTLLSAGLWDELGRLCDDVAMVSTLTIGLDRPGSDLDILCQHPAPAVLAVRLASKGWRVSDKEAVMCRLLGLGGDPYEARLILEGRALAGLCWFPLPRPADYPCDSRQRDSLTMMPRTS